MITSESLCCVGVDLGTSGCRAVAIDPQGTVLAQAKTDLPLPISKAPGHWQQAPEIWWQALTQVLRQLGEQLSSYTHCYLAIDGTSGTLLLADPAGKPFGDALLYHDRRATEALAQIAEVAPAESPVHSASSSLAKLIYLLAQGDNAQQQPLALHQADWLSGRLTGRYGLSDENNVLKLGYDAVGRCWPDWLARLIPLDSLPQVLPPGSLIGPIQSTLIEQLGLPVNTWVVTGTTDSTAATLATGIQNPGEAVTALGSTLVIKILSEQPVFAAQFGVYSHRLGDLWLVGGASNSGGAVLRHFFSLAEIQDLTKQLRPDEPTGLHYYPLRQAGERFPINDSNWPPCLTPRPAEDWRFLQGLLEGIAQIEQQGYQRLTQLGAPMPTAIHSIGGGAINLAWQQIRADLLQVPVKVAAQQEAAYGTARLALKAWVALKSG